MSIDRDDTRVAERTGTEAGAAFAARIAEEFAPAPLTDGQRRAFDGALRERIERGRKPLRWAPALALASAAALAAFVAISWSRIPTGEDAVARSPEEAIAAAEWESELFDTDSFRLEDDLDDLPPEYAAIGGLLLGG